MQMRASGPFQQYQTRAGNFTADANSLIYGVTSGIALLDLLEEGCVPEEFNPVANFRNLIDCGDFTINPWQRGTTFTGISSTAKYTADRWAAVGGASSSISVSKVAVTAVPTFSQALQFGRANANANTAPISLTQVVETADTIRAQGHYATFSFWAAAGALFSGAGLTVAVQYGTGVDQSLANLNAGTWTGQAYPANVPAQANATGGVAGAFGVGTPVLQPITSSWIRYAFTVFIPSNATQMAVTVGYTPVGTAGATDYVQFIGFQLELSAQVSVFEHRDAQVELEISQRYCWVTAEPAVGVIVAVGGAVAAANAQVYYMAAPVQFRTAPTVTIVAGSWQACVAAAAAAATVAAGTTHTVNAISVTTALTQTVGLAATLQGGGGAGSITASADY